MSIRLFEGDRHAELYATYRPVYPEVINQIIKDYCTGPESSGSELAIDVGCGPGQSTFPLCEIFDKVIGLDISCCQIEQAKELQSIDDRYDHKRLRFRVGPAEDLSFLADKSVDLVTVATAIHWLDLGLFYTEVDRILKPGGALVVYLYQMPRPHKAEAAQMVDEFFEAYISEYTSSRAYPKLEDFEIPYDDKDGLRHFPMNYTLNLKQYVGLVLSMSCTQTYLRHHPSSNIFDEFEKRLKELYVDPASKEEYPVHMTSAVSIRTGRKPQG